MKDKELKLEEIVSSHTLGGSGEVQESCPGERETERSQQIHTIVNTSHNNRHMGEGLVAGKNPMNLCSCVSEVRGHGEGAGVHSD